MVRKPIKFRPTEPEVDLEQIESRGPLNTLELAPSAASSSMAIALTRAEIDQQVVTAHAYPRELSVVKQNIMQYATDDEPTAQECIYALPRGGKALRGPSIRFAEIVANQWRNQRNAARVIHRDIIEKYVEAEGQFHDIETGSITVARVRRSIQDRDGRLYKPDMILVAEQAACAIARRNAILGGIPKVAWRAAYQAVESVIAGDAKTIGERRESALKAFNAMGITDQRVFEALEIKGVDDVGVDELVQLTAMRNAIRSGETSIESLFPEKKATGPAPVGLAQKLDALAAKPAVEGSQQPPEQREPNDERHDGDQG